MATAGEKPVNYKLVSVATLELEEDDIDPWYTSFVILPGDMLLVVDGWFCNVRLHSLQDGQILARSDKLLSRPYGACVCTTQDNDIQLAVSLVKAQIEILSVKFIGTIVNITRVRTLDVSSGFRRCYAVKHFKENLLVSGRSLDNLCWGIASIKDGYVATVNTICKRGRYGGVSYLATDPTNDKFYISCCGDADSHENTGLYGYDAVISTKWEFLYQHSDLRNPKGISVDARGFIFVCNWNNPPCIHQLTQRGVPVAVHMEVGVPPGIYAIFCEKQREELYITCTGSNIVRRFKLEYADYHDPVIPAEILKMDTRSLDIYKEALQSGKEKVYNIRLMVVGQYGVGKTTLTKRLLGEDVLIYNRKSTEGIDVHVECCKVSLATGEWLTQEKNAEQYSRLQRLVKLLNKHVNEQGMNDVGCQYANKECSTQQCIETRIHQTINQPMQNTTSVENTILLHRGEEAQLPYAIVDGGIVENASLKKNTVVSPGSEEQSGKSEEKDIVLEILHLVNLNANKLEKSLTEYAALTMWDFAGQYIFYTTHQMFLTSRAIYLLVIDLCQELTDLIKDDEYFLDREGIIQCKVRDLIEIWLNSIHSCAHSSNAGIVPVILVGTHADQLPEKSRQDIIDEYFKKVRLILNDKPTILHLKDDIAIDNTMSDPKLWELKRRIFELASQQPHWGEEKPARWIPLEQAMMTLKASGVKVAPLSLVEEINRSGSIRIEVREELDLFLRYQHEIGTILYFSVEGLRENIVLDPQWLIDALKTLITADQFMRKFPAIAKKWCEFSEKGKLTQELIDAIWTRELNPEFHDNKVHILLLMEKLHIIARPRSYSEDREEVKEEDYYLAPCMLRQTTPKQIISPKSHFKKEITSVLCFVCTEKFIPPPVFHRLIGACLTRWPISKQKSDNLIYCGCCVFNLDLHHRLTLYLNHYSICARVTRMGFTDVSWCSKHGSETRRFISENLSKIIGNLCEGLQFELHVQCPDSDAGNVEGLIAVPLLQNNVNVPCHSHNESHVLVSKELLQFWFEEEESPKEDVEDPVLSLEDEVLSERQLGRLSLNIGREFFRLGLELELSEANIQQIQNNYPDTATTCLMTLVKWKQQNQDKATFKNLEEAFKVVGIDIGILKSVRTTVDRVSCLPQTILDMQPDDRHLSEISTRVGKEYVHLGVELGVAVSRIEQICVKHPHDLPKQCLEIMRQWKQKKHVNANFRTLEQAFRRVGIDRSILRLCMK
ncbi:hypothetical protein CHS0354_010180 [Potamilus streckersoni]|uniref:non-specific serine/threonine protein kinase n=1 Tax=Potamilus streckersoni TaxID=2493646 RepID=A0AAE0S3E6_9BIVA|nr:hypothetical protein CHS0354_010180 [Potamilus streckersoni]